MRKLSVVIITFNEEECIGRCIASVRQLADEIVIVDSYSSDATIAIAEMMGARVIEQEFLGYVQQKNFAMMQASNPFVLSIDADEEVSAELAMSILEAKKTSDFDVYVCHRMANYCGKWIRHGGWYPDKKLRLFDKSKGNWVGESIHEKWLPSNNRQAIGVLQGDLLHYSFTSISNHLKQIENFTEIAAKQAISCGKTCSIIKVWLSPKWRFFNDYFLHLGILDGYAGYLIAKYSAFATQVKYSKIRHYSMLTKTKNFKMIDLTKYSRIVQKAQSVK